MIEFEIENNIFEHVNRKTANIKKIDFGNNVEIEKKESLEENLFNENEDFFNNKIDDILNDKFFDKNNTFFLENNIIKYFLKIGSSLIIDKECSTPKLDKDTFEDSINNIGIKIKKLIKNNDNILEKIELLEDLEKEYSEKYSETSSIKQEEIKIKNLTLEKENLEKNYNKLLEELSNHYNKFNKD